MGRESTTSLLSSAKKAPQRPSVGQIGARSPRKSPSFSGVNWPVRTHTTPFDSPYYAKLFPRNNLSVLRSKNDVTVEDETRELEHDEDRQYGNRQDGPVLVSLALALDVSGRVHLQSSLESKYRSKSLDVHSSPVPFDRIERLVTEESSLRTPDVS